MSNNFYEVKRGDTLWGICKREFNLTNNTEIAKKVAEISKNNSIFDGHIEIGQELNLGAEEKVSNNTAKLPEQPVTKQAETKETVTPTNTQANQKTTPKKEITKMCEHEHCHCEEGIFKSALRHTVQVFLFVLLLFFMFNSSSEKFFAKKYSQNSLCLSIAICLKEVLMYIFLSPFK